MADQAGQGVPSGPGHDPTGDRYAVLCATKPGQYLALRVVAGLAAVLVLSFVIDLMALLTWAMAHLPFLMWWVTGEFGDDVRRFAEGRPPILPVGGWRLVALVACVIIVVSGVRLAVGGLPSGRRHMEATVGGGSVWPGLWAPVARTAEVVRPWFVTAAGGLTPLVVFNATGEDWSYFPLAIMLGLALAWVVDFTARRGGFWLTQFVPSGIDITLSDVSAAEDVERSRRSEEALRRWPQLPELRLPSALQVMTAPPPPTGRRARQRDAWWAGRPTSVEDLASEFIAQAIVDAESHGLVQLRNGRFRSPRLTSTLPPDRQPEGLAALVAGCHPVGETPGRSPTTLALALDDIAGVDPFANIIAVAMADLKSADVARRHPTTGAWELSAEQLRAKTASHWPRGGDSSREARIAALRPVVRRLIGRRKTTDGGSDNGGQMLAYVFMQHHERNERRRYELPGPFEAGSG